MANSTTGPCEEQPAKLWLPAPVRARLESRAIENGLNPGGLIRWWTRLAARPNPRRCARSLAARTTEPNPLTFSRSSWHLWRDCSRLAQMRWKTSVPRALATRPLGARYVALPLVATVVGPTKRPDQTVVALQSVVQFLEVWNTTREPRTRPIRS